MKTPNNITEPNLQLEEAFRAVLVNHVNLTTAQENWNRSASLARNIHEKLRAGDAHEFIINYQGGWWSITMQCNSWVIKKVTVFPADEEVDMA